MGMLQPTNQMGCFLPHSQLKLTRLRVLHVAKTLYTLICRLPLTSQDKTWQKKRGRESVVFWQTIDLAL